MTRVLEIRQLIVISLGEVKKPRAVGLGQLVNRLLIASKELAVSRFEMLEKVLGAQT